MRIKCDFCGKERYKQPAHLKKNKHNFCSRECYHRYQRETWVYPVTEEKNSFFHRLIKRIGGASNENKENQKVPTTGIQGFAQNQN